MTPLFPRKTLLGINIFTSLTFPPLWSVLSSRRNNTEVVEPHFTNIYVHLAQGSRFIPLALEGEQRRGNCVGLEHTNACSGKLTCVICIRATHLSWQIPAPVKHHKFIYCQWLGGKAPADQCGNNRDGRKLKDQA